VRCENAGEASLARAQLDKGGGGSLFSLFVPCEDSSFFHITQLFASFLPVKLPLPTAPKSYLLQVAELAKLTIISTRYPLVRIGFFRVLLFYRESAKILCGPSYGEWTRFHINGSR